ncbi:odorant receptor 67a-like isoform X1 [Cydia fagiglandana]|uniref:odorant receptor 67a-like isoform X1 n=1 Tax=Cydia fagiglandana TaxID=1458189 RepID=UPI002FEE193D
MSQRLFTARTDKYQQIIKSYLLEFHLFYFKNRSPYATKIYKQMQIVSRIFTIIVPCIILSGVTLFNFTPWYANYRSGMFGPDRPPNTTFQHAVYFHCFTEDVYTTLNAYWILFIFNIPISIHTTCGLLAFDLLLCLIVLQIMGHLKIMKHSLSNITRKADMYSAEENMRVRESLKDIVVHHNIIIKFVNKCSDTYSEYLFAFYSLMQILSIISLLEVAAFTPEALAKYGPLTYALHQQLILVSILFEMISSRSTELIDAIYDIPWECMDTRNRRTAMVLLMRAQTPVTLKAAKMVPVGVTTMSAVLKTSASYYMALNAVAKERQMDQR